MEKAEITIRVSAREDFVPVSSFLTIVGNAISILKDIERTTKTKGPSQWKVSGASLRSPLTFTIFSDSDQGKEIAHEYMRVFEEAEKTDEIDIPRWFPGILEKAKQLVSVLGDGVSQIAFSVPGRASVNATQRVAATADYLLSPVYEDYGSLEGTLETLSVHGKAHFTIFDPITGKAVRCYFPSNKLEDAYRAFNRRVTVTGKAKYNRMGNAVSISVEKIRELEGGVTTREMEGINITEGTDSAGYVRGLRDA